MGYFATDIHEPAPPLGTDPGRVRQHPVCGQKPLRGPIHNAISGYRFYNPELGRWINRDPIGEWGGENIYSMAKNVFVNYFDILGLNTCSVDLSAEWSEGPNMQNVKVKNINGSVGVNVALPILFLAIASPSHIFNEPDIKYHGSASIYGEISGKVNCKASCKCSFGIINYEGDSVWNADPEIKLMTTLKFQYERKWPDFISDVNAGSNFLIDASLQCFLVL